MSHMLSNITAFRQGSMYGPWIVWCLPAITSYPPLYVPTALRRHRTTEEGPADGGAMQAQC